MFSADHVYNTNHRYDFPGHAFVIWKINKKTLIILQSYIDKYHINDGIRIFNKVNMIKQLYKWTYFAKLGRFDQIVLNHWKKFTSIDIDHLHGYEFDKSGVQCTIYYIDFS